MAALPAFGWYTAPPVGRPTHASGFAGAGQLWLLPVLGALVVLAGALQLSARPASAAATARVAGGLAAACGALALGLAVWAAADPRLEFAVGLPGGAGARARRGLLEAAAVATPLVAGAVLLVGLALAGPAAAREAPHPAGGVGLLAGPGHRDRHRPEPPVGLPERGVDPAVPDAGSRCSAAGTRPGTSTSPPRLAHDMGQVGEVFTNLAFFPLMPGIMAAAIGIGSTRSSRRW